MERQESSILTEMELVKSKMKLTPEERKKEARGQIYVELKAMEMERRKRAALEGEREEREKDQEERTRQEAKKREERRANEQKAPEKAKQDQLKQERLHGEKIMMVEKELVKGPEAELFHLPKVGGKAGPVHPTPRLKAEQQGKRKTLHNNWAGGQITNSESAKEELPSNSSTYLLFAAKRGPKSKGKPKPPKSKQTPQWLQGRLKVGHWVDEFKDRSERKDGEEQYARWAAFKASRAGHFSRRFDCYSILKSVF